MMDIDMLRIGDKIRTTIDDGRAVTVTIKDIALLNAYGREVEPMLDIVHDIDGKVKTQTLMLYNFNRWLNDAKWEKVE